MTTDPTRPSDPIPPDPTPSEPVPPPTTPPPTTPPPTTPPPVGTGMPAAPPPTSSTGFTQPPATSAPAGTSMSFDRTKVSTLDLALGGAAVLFLIALLLPWVSVSIEGAGSAFSESTNGFSSSLLTFAWILLVLAAVIVLLPAMGVNFKLPFPRGIAVLVATGLALLFVLIEFIDVLGAEDELGGLGAGVDVSTGIGAWLGALVAIGAVVVAVMMFRGDKARPVAA